MRTILSIAVLLGAFASVAKAQETAGPQVRVTGIVCFATQTSLTTTEALRGLDLVAALHGLEFVPVDEDKISVRPRPAGADTALVQK